MSPDNGAAAPVSDGLTASQASRLPGVDIARGVALVAMAVYHLSWDLGFFGLIQLDVSRDPAWRLFAKLIAGSFLLLVGVSLTLAARGGLRPKPYLTRLAMIAGAAGLVSLGTWLATPDSFVYFGILHCIALSSVLALPFLRAPISLVMMSAALAAALPSFVSSDRFNAPWLLWTGLAGEVPATNDFAPILPWFGAVLAGMVLARVGLPRLGPGNLLSRSPKRLPGRLLAWAGRHSLAVYLAHQPFFFVALWAFTAATGLPRADEGTFLTSCVGQCAARDMDTEKCRRMCTCVREELGGADALTRRAPSPADRRRIIETVEACRTVADPPPKP